MINVNSGITFKSHISILLAYLVHCDDVIAVAVDRLGPKDIAAVIPNDHGTVYGFMWHCIRKYYIDYASQIPKMSLQSALAQQPAVSMMPPAVQQTFADTIDHIYDLKDENFEVDEGIRIMSEVLDSCHVKLKLRNLTMVGDPSSEEIFTVVKAGIEKSVISAVQPLDFLADLDSIFDYAIAEPIGGNDIAYFNAACSGGLKQSETCVIIGPTGGYKTTMALDIVASMAATKTYTMFSSYEQAATSGNLQFRMLSRLAGIHSDRLSDPSFRTTITPDEDARMRKAQELSPYVHWLDKAEAVDKVSDIAAQVAEFTRRGMKPELIVIDQLVDWMERWEEIIDSPDRLRRAAQTVISALKHQVAEKYNTRVVVLHQLKSSEIGKSASRKPKKDDSSEVKGLPNAADFTLMMGNECQDTNCLWLIPAKTRRKRHPDIILHANGGLGRMSMASDYEASKGGHGSFVKKGQSDHIPSGSNGMLMGEF